MPAPNALRKQVGNLPRRQQEDRSGAGQDRANRAAHRGRGPTQRHRRGPTRAASSSNPSPRSCVTAIRLDEGQVSEVN